tara:strand:- start:1277 stop:1522 length:246 start_codon:yes stop_codon:yes gene_type:complete
MSSHFKTIGVHDRAKAVKTLTDYSETTYFPCKIDEVINCLLHKQMIHTIQEITDKLIHGEYGIEQLKNIATDLTKNPRRAS